MACLEFFRWCCCCVLVLSGIIGCVIGALLIALGGILLWGYSILNSAIGLLQLGDLNKLVSQVLGPEFSLDAFIRGLSQIASSAAIVFIVVGVLIIIISCVGWCGACWKIQGCLIAYMIVVSLFIIAEAALVILWFSNRELLKGTVKSSLSDQVSKYQGLLSPDVSSLTVNVLQVAVGCCGVTNGSDFDANTQWNRNYTVTDSANNSFTYELKYPITCCQYEINMQLKSQYCPYNLTASNHEIGCYEKIFSSIERQFRLDNVFFGLIGFAGVEILLVIGAILICCAARREEDELAGARDEGYKMQPMA